MYVYHRMAGLKGPIQFQPPPRAGLSPTRPGCQGSIQPGLDLFHKQLLFTIAADRVAQGRPRLVRYQTQLRAAVSAVQPPANERRKGGGPGTARHRLSTVSRLAPIHLSGCASAARLRSPLSATSPPRGRGASRADRGRLPPRRGTGKAHPTLGSPRSVPTGLGRSPFQLPAPPHAAAGHRARRRRCQTHPSLVGNEDRDPVPNPARSLPIPALIPGTLPLSRFPAGLTCRGGAERGGTLPETDGSARPLTAPPPPPHSP